MHEKSVLVVEDDENIREVLQLVLESEGYLVHTAENGQEGVKFLKENAETSLILLDLMMPVMDGWAFLEQRKLDPRLAAIPVVVLSASGLSEKPEGATAFLSKPVELHNLLRVTQSHCLKVA